MEILSVIAMLLLSLMGYSGSIVFKAGKTMNPQPALVDLLLIIITWATLLTLRFTVDIDGFIFLIIGLGTSIILGAAILPFRTLSGEKIIEAPADKPEAGSLKKAWRSWLDFSKRIGHFQSRMTLAVFYLTLVAPIGISVRLFSDPLNIKKSEVSTRWTDTEPNAADAEQYRRQY